MCVPVQYLKDYISFLINEILNTNDKKKVHFKQDWRNTHRTYLNLRAAQKKKKKNLSKKRINQKMFRNIVSPHWGQEWTPSCHFPTRHTHFAACPPVLEVSAGRMRLWLWIKLLWKELRGSWGGPAGGPPPRSGAAFKLSPWSSPGLCCKWAGTWPSTLLTWA